MTTHMDYTRKRPGKKHHIAKCPSCGKNAKLEVYMVSQNSDEVSGHLYVHSEDHAVSEFAPGFPMISVSNRVTCRGGKGVPEGWDLKTRWIKK